MINEKVSLRKRYAGVLMHISSLPGPAYIGDIGPCAKKFADFLYRSNQSYWQLLPIQPINALQGYSPYSSFSSIAGNIILISPELLAKDGLINKNLISRKNSSTRTDYVSAEKYKEKLLRIAYDKWNATTLRADKKIFDEYCQKEKEWLHDYALYSVLKIKYNNKSWIQWPDEFRNRDLKSLQFFARENSDDIGFIKWTQMIFNKQWKQLKSYCDSLKITLLGDVPFYVSHDSADVWCNKEIFMLDKNGKALEVAGVPPDLFNKEGQLWGMPLYNWDVLKNNRYKWWINRLKKNLEYFDELRLDHFRAFSSYWSIPAYASSAKKGKWKKGSGKDFFETIKNVLGNLPFVAEDLGKVDEKVFRLRNELDLPGMNVLQFAFGEDTPDTPHLPHYHKYNSFVFTGTHDNDTTRGWYNKLEKKYRKLISDYTGAEVNTRNIADHLCEMAYRSTSKVSILPAQDILSLGSSERMNVPSSPKDNWKWRIKQGQLTTDIIHKLNNWCYIYGRTRS
ncbi:MAG: 4-alpha-glucanotransferase [Chitinophagaceae bacterium]|nr:4-alpha-glucanotransferase [Chitinophagaceae bacterium]